MVHNYFLFYLFHLLICYSNAAAIDNTTTNTELEHVETTSSKNQNSKCLELHKSLKDTNFTNFLNECNKIKAGESITTINENNEREARCFIIRNTFESACNTTDSQKVLPKIENVQIDTVCVALQNFFSPHKNAFLSNFFKNLDSCSALCTGKYDKERIVETCVIATYLANLTVSKKNSTEPAFKAPTPPISGDTYNNPISQPDPDSLNSNIIENMQDKNEKPSQDTTKSVTSIQPVSIKSQSDNSSAQNESSTMKPKKASDAYSASISNPAEVSKDHNSIYGENLADVSDMSSKPGVTEIIKPFEESVVDQLDEENDEVSEKIKAEEKPKPLETDEDTVSYSGSYANVEEDDSYFFSYFMLVCIIFILGYVGYHNKQKILALVLEGRRGKRENRRRPNSANYHKLDCNLEEAVTSSCNKNTTNVIY